MNLHSHSNQWRAVLPLLTQADDLEYEDLNKQSTL